MTWPLVPGGTGHSIRWHEPPRSLQVTGAGYKMSKKNPRGALVAPLLKAGPLKDASQRLCWLVCAPVTTRAFASGLKSEKCFSSAMRIGSQRMPEETPTHIFVAILPRTSPSVTLGHLPEVSPPCITVGGNWRRWKGAGHGGGNGEGWNDWRWMFQHPGSQGGVAIFLLIQPFHLRHSGVTAFSL